MKILNLNFIMLFLTIGIFSISFADYNKIEVTSGEWAPFTSEKDVEGKLAEDLLVEALRLVEIEVSFNYYPWKRTYEAAKKGEAHATILWLKSSKREEEFIIGEEFLVEDQDVFFHLKSTEFEWEKIEDLKKYEIGATEAYYQAEYLRKFGIKTSEVSSEILNFRKILANRIDVYFTSYYVGYNIIKKEFAQKMGLFTHNEKPLRRAKFYVMVSRNIPKAQELSDKIDKGIRELKNSGRYNEIIEEYFK